MANTKKMKLDSKTINISFAVLFGLVVGAIGTVLLRNSNAATNNTSGSSITLNQSDPSVGQMITFATTVPKLTGNQTPIVVSECYQNNTVVWGEVDTVSAAASGIKLGGDSSPWLSNGGGTANCVAYLAAQWWKGGMEYRNTLSTTTFIAQ